MGVDISSESGVVVTVDRLVEIVRESNRERACRALLRCTAITLQTLKVDYSNEELDRNDPLFKKAALLAQVFGELSVDSDVESIRTMLKNLARGVDAGFDSYVENSDEAIAIWSELINDLYPDAPKPVSTAFIDSPRYQGWDVPQGEVLFVFTEDECFERVKTEAGKELDAMIGESTELSTWTDYSC